MAPAEDLQTCELKSDHPADGDVIARQNVLHLAGGDQWGESDGAACTAYSGDSAARWWITRFTRMPGVTSASGPSSPRVRCATLSSSSRLVGWSSSIIMEPVLREWLVPGWRGKARAFN